VRACVCVCARACVLACARLRVLVLVRVRVRACVRAGACEAMRRGWNRQRGQSSCDDHCQVEYINTLEVRVVQKTIISAMKTRLELPETSVLSTNLTTI
jgi:hypothetical protein